MIVVPRGAARPTAPRAGTNESLCMHTHAGTHESLCMHTHTYDREEEITGFSCACSPPIWPVNPISSQKTQHDSHQQGVLRRALSSAPYTAASMESAAAKEVVRALECPVCYNQ